MPRSPLQVELSLEAELDFVEILIYSERQFGPEQEVIYGQWIDAAIARIAGMPGLGKPVPRGDYYRYHISNAGNRGSHFLYYQYDDKRLLISRILHERQDYAMQPPFVDN